MRKVYPSDVSRERFEKVRPILEKARKSTKPRRVDLYEVFCGVLYVLKSGCQWRMLPSEYLDWNTVYSYFVRWNTRGSEDELSLLEQTLKKCGWRGPRQPWLQRKDDVLHR